MLHPAHTSREPTPSSDKEKPTDVTAHCAQVGIKGSNKRCKQRPLGTGTTTSHDDGRDWEVGSSDVGNVSTAVRSNRHLVRLATDHFKRLLEEACPNHAYSIKHKLKDCGLMQNFMTSGSLI
jgi:hypothetical protein